MTIAELIRRLARLGKATAKLKASLGSGNSSITASCISRGMVLKYELETIAEALEEVVEIDIVVWASIPDSNC